MWGESGYIRLLRVDPSSLPVPDAACGMDVTPTDGAGCTKDDTGKDIVPPARKICGTSGVLNQAVVPLGAHLI
jgi:hypothetical protein